MEGERGDLTAAMRRVARGIAVDPSLEGECARAPLKAGRQLQVGDGPLATNRSAHKSEQRQSRIGSSEHREGEWLRLQVDVIREILLTPRDASVSGEVRGLARAVAVHDVRIRKAHVEPGGVERRLPRDRSSELGKVRVEILRSAEIHRGDIDIEVSEARECRLEDVQLTATADTRDGAANMRVVEQRLRFVDREARQRPAAGAHAAEKLTAPIDRKWFAVERAQQIEVHGLRRESYVLHGEDGTANREGHVADEMRSGAHHIHRGELVVDDTQVLAFVADVQHHRAPASGRQRGVDPVHVAECMAGFAARNCACCTSDSCCVSPS